MDARERKVVVVTATLFLIAAVALAVFLPSEREVSPLLVLCLVVGHAVVSRVRFEFVGGYVVPEQLVIVPLMLLGPLPLVPLLIAVAGIIAVIPDYLRGS